MKVKVISRSATDYTRSRSQDIFKVHRNLSTDLHPFQRAREYVRAVNAVKLDRIFAKPFVGAMGGHADGVYCLSRHPRQLTCLVSGSADGEVRVWNVGSRGCVWRANAHKGFVRGVSVTSGGDGILSVGDDKCVRLWSMDYDNRNWTNPVDDEPDAIFIGKTAYTAVDHHQKNEWFCTSSAQVDVWDMNRSSPLHTFSWGADTINTVRFNKTEVNILASCGSDRNVVLYDIRSSKPLTKLVLEMRSNAIAWNPMEAFNFTVANEDHNCYTFDMRKMGKALNVLKDHVSAVMDLDYSPTGHEIATGAYDRSIRIFRASDGHSRDVYHTKRMQRVFCVKFTLDNKYIISGSDDCNLRIWKARASEPLVKPPPRQRASLEYNEALKEKFKHLPEVSRISKQRNVPKAIYNATAAKKTMLAAIARKQENERKHSRPGSVPQGRERKKHVVAVEE